MIARGGASRGGCPGRIRELTRLCFFEPPSDRRLGLNGRQTEQRLRVGRALPGLPVLHEALSAGALCWSAVRELSRVAVAETEQAWREWASGKASRQVERAVGSRQPGGNPPAQQNLPRRLRRSPPSPQSRQQQHHLSSRHLPAPRRRPRPPPPRLNPHPPPRPAAPTREPPHTCVQHPKRTLFRPLGTTKTRPRRANRLSDQVTPAPNSERAAGLRRSTLFGVAGVAGSAARLVCGGQPCSGSQK